MSLGETITTLEQNHSGLLEKADRLYDVFANLRYEKKADLDKRMRAVREGLDFFEEKLVPHMELEEIIFSFLAMHVPKLESIIRLLQSEHKELKMNLELVRFLILYVRIEE